MEKNGLKVSRAKTEHLQRTGDTDPVRMKRYMETEMVNLPVVQISWINERQRGASKDVDSRVAKAWSKWRDLRQEIPNKIEAPDIPDSDSTDVVVWLRNMANIS